MKSIQTFPDPVYFFHFVSIIRFGPEEWNELDAEVFTQGSMTTITRPVGMFPVFDQCYPGLVSHNHGSSSSWTCNAWISHGTHCIPFDKSICQKGNVLFCNCLYKDVHNVWFFELDSKFRMNITFKNVCFSSPNCDQGNITISSKNKHKFCGCVSFFLLYLLEKSVSVYLHVLTDIHVELNASFSVVDRHTLFTAYTQTAVKSFQFPNTYRILKEVVVHFRRNITAFSFLIQVQKAFQVIITGELLSASQAFDGPGYFSNILRLRRNMYEASTFQCLVVLHMEPVSNPIDYGLWFTSRGINNIQTVGISALFANLFDMPRQGCSQFMCVVQLWTDSTLQVNITVSKIIYSGMRSFSCQYGGFVVAENLLGDYKESPVLCRPHKGSKEQSTHFYSLNSSLLVVLYWYKEYSNISVALMASETKCKPVYFDFCFFHKICTSKHLKDVRTCRNYLKTITTHTDLQLFAHERVKAFQFELFSFPHHEYSFYDRPQTLSFSAQSETCTVLQLIPSQNFADSEGESLTCEIDIAPSLHSNQQHEIRYEILGLFSQMRTNHEQYSKFVNCIQFSGAAQKFCFQGHCQTNHEIVYPAMCNQGNIFYMVTFPVQGNSFTIHLSKQTVGWMSQSPSPNHRHQGNYAMTLSLWTFSLLVKEHICIHPKSITILPMNLAQKAQKYFWNSSQPKISS